MTKRFLRRIQCPKCGEYFDPRDPVLQWISNEPELDSVRQGITVNNIDVSIHHYKDNKDLIGDRTVELMMDVEIKTHAAISDISQRDSLSIRSQFLRNRKSNPQRCRTGRHALDWERPAKVFSIKKKKWVAARHFGHHEWRLEKNDPMDSDWMEWDRKRIDMNTLIKILNFTLDPDNLKQLDLRRHHKKDYPLFEAI